MRAASMLSSLSKAARHLTWQQPSSLTPLPACLDAPERIPMQLLPTQIPLKDAARLLGIGVMPETWISLPRNRWPKDGSWEKIEDPVCPLLQNLYGHPLAGLLWDQGSQVKILSCGFEKLAGWESLYVHKKRQIYLSVYAFSHGREERKHEKHLGTPEN